MMAQSRAEPQQPSPTADGLHVRPEPQISASTATRLWVETLRLGNFRNYANTALKFGPEPVVLIGANGSGKTNLMEAVSMLAAGQGLRRAPFPELARAGGSGDWAVAARLQTINGPIDIGTGLQAGASQSSRAGRIVKLNGDVQTGSGVLADHVEMLWVTPAMDGLFTGPASDRRRFLDRLILAFDPGYRTRLGHFERAMTQRNRLLSDNVRAPAQFEGLERILAETGVAIAAARAEAVAQLSSTIRARRKRLPNSPFPWAMIDITGELEEELVQTPAVDVEDHYARSLAINRERDRAAGRTIDGPHRSDLVVSHGPKAMPGKLCSTGEQKALLVGMVLAHAELIKQRRQGAAPILLLDEIAAHFDPMRRAALFDDIITLGTQAWMTGTDHEAFAALGRRAAVYRVENASVLRLSPAT
jgi:DNA replication and repair protein RecF